jgi:hypothetical protein
MLKKHGERKLEMVVWWPRSDAFRFGLERE